MPVPTTAEQATHAVLWILLVSTPHPPWAHQPQLLLVRVTLELLCTQALAVLLAVLAVRHQAAAAAITTMATVTATMITTAIPNLVQAISQSILVESMALVLWSLAFLLDSSWYRLCTLLRTQASGISITERDEKLLWWRDLLHFGRSTSITAGRRGTGFVPKSNDFCKA